MSLYAEVIDRNTVKCTRDTTRVMHADPRLHFPLRTMKGMRSTCVYASLIGWKHSCITSRAMLSWRLLAGSSGVAGALGGGGGPRTAPGVPWAPAVGSQTFPENGNVEVLLQRDGLAHPDHASP